MERFDYDAAFSRNIGWVTDAEQNRLRQARVAIGGLGGVGGVHLLTLARLGVGKFSIADFDVFDIVNFNRQVGATMSSLGKPKLDVLSQMARDINPEIELRCFSDGITPGSIEDFMKDVDVYVDGLDFFAFEAREKLFAHCFKSGIPAITVAPLGMSAALLNFLPGHMSFEEYFQVEGKSELEKAVHFLVGLAPGLLHRHYLADKSRVDLKSRKGPSTIIACQLCAGVAASETLKILLKRGKVWPAPHAVQFDGYRNKLVRTWRPNGNSHPFNRLAIAIAKRQLGLDY